MKTFFLKFVPALAAVTLSACTLIAGKVPIGDNERHNSAVLALLCADVMDMFQADKTNPTPPVVHSTYSLLDKNWVIDGYLVGDDRTLAQALKHEIVPSARAMYGVLAHSNGDPNNFIVVIRGTGDIREGEIDSWFWSRPDKWNDKHGKVETGFFTVYTTLQYYPAANAAARGTAWEGIKAVVGNNSLTIAGHSLGAPLATYLTMDLISNGGLKNIKSRYFASPRPGNSDFADAFEKEIQHSHSEYIVYNNNDDVVPHVPPSLLGLFYQQLSNVVVLDRSNSEVRITDDIGCNHHVTSYAAMLDIHLLPDINAWNQRAETSKACINSK